MEWLGENKELLWWLTGASAVLFIVTLIGIVVVIVRLPPGYFAHASRPPSKWGSKHVVGQIALKVLKNVVGASFVLAGLAMLLLPGQGVLAIIVGLVLLDLPGKYRLEKWLASRPRVLSAMNWLRGKLGRAELKAPSKTGKGRHTVTSQPV